MTEKKFKYHLDPSRPALPPLYAIANLDSLQSPLQSIKDMLAAGIELIQVRSKSHIPSNLSAIIDEALKESQPYPQAKIIINDFVELARSSGAHGVHLGQSDGSVALAREILGPEAIIGLSTHTLSQILDAPSAYLDYLALGPVFSSSTKRGHAAEVGLSVVRQASGAAPLPLVAIGGITKENAREVFHAGAQSVAIIADLEKELPKGTANLMRYCQQFSDARSKASADSL